MFNFQTLFGCHLILYHPKGIYNNTLKLIQDRYPYHVKNPPTDLQGKNMPTSLLIHFTTNQIEQLILGS